MRIKKWIDFNEKFSSTRFNSDIKLAYLLERQHQLLEIGFCLPRTGLLDKEGGGKIFFNKLDKVIKEDPDIIKEITQGLKDKYLVSSGGFGDNLFNLWESGSLECKGVLVFNGKIVTKKKGINYYYPEEFDVDNKSFVFVDDSYFSGKTMREIEKYLLEEHQSTISEIRVGYDGSKEKNPKVKSLYRYYP